MFHLSQGLVTIVQFTSNIKGEKSEVTAVIHEFIRALAHPERK